MASFLRSCCPGLATERVALPQTARPSRFPSPEPGACFLPCLWLPRAQHARGRTLPTPQSPRFRPKAPEQSRGLVFSSCNPVAAGRQSQGAQGTASGPAFLPVGSGGGGRGHATATHGSAAHGPQTTAHVCPCGAFPAPGRPLRPSSPAVASAVFVSAFLEEVFPCRL